MAYRCIFFLILFIADSIAVNQIPISVYKKIQGLSTYDFAKNHLYKKQRDFASDQVDGRVSNTGPSGSRPESGVVRPGHGLQVPQASGSDGLRREAYPGESLIFTDNGSIQPQNVMAQLQLAKEASCSPMPQPVHLPPDLDPMVIYYPSWVLVNKCTGGCEPEYMSCQATRRRNKLVRVMKNRLTRITGKEMFASEGTIDLIVEEDEACECGCTVKATACNPSVHWYDSDTCSCRCTNERLASSCIHPRTWSASLCACTCPPVTCPPGHAFHETTCTCMPCTSNYFMTPDPCVASKKCWRGWRGRTTSGGCVCLPQRLANLLSPAADYVTANPI